MIHSLLAYLSTALVYPSFCTLSSKAAALVLFSFVFAPSPALTCQKALVETALVETASMTLPTIDKPGMAALWADEQIR